MYLYHKNIGFPKTLKIDEHYSLNLNLSFHAKEACFNDRYGRIIVKSCISFDRRDIIEIESFDNKTPTKFLIRIKYDNQTDISLAIQLDSNTIKTVWLNDKNDNHNTLNRNKYDKPQNQIIKIKF